jgi:hypothetical protein
MAAIQERLVHYLTEPFARGLDRRDNGAGSISRRR